MIEETLTPIDSMESTARRVVDYLREGGISRPNICDEHLIDFYAALKMTPYSAKKFFPEPPKLQPHGKPVEDMVWGVIVETREHPALEYIVCQFSERLNIGIQLFHGAANLSFIMASNISVLVAQGKVELTLIDTELLPASAYNALLLSSEFWNAQLGRKKILIFQTDAILCAQSDYGLRDFIDYDYIGSNWERKRPIGITVDGGSGGLSLRDWHMTVNSIHRFSPDLWPGGEDGYFAFHIDLMGGRVGRGDNCAKFSTQDKFLFRSFGGHQLTNLSSHSLSSFIRYCPEVSHILSSQ